MTTTIIQDETQAIRAAMDALKTISMDIAPSQEALYELWEMAHSTATPEEVTVYQEWHLGPIGAERV